MYLEESDMSSKRYFSAAVLSLAIAPLVRADITLDGVLDLDYGAALALQTNNTGFGNSTSGDGSSSGGSELDAAYAQVQSGKLHIFLAGNLQHGGTYNHINLFIADGRAGQNTINASGVLGAMNGSKFSPDFNATYALDITSDATTYFNQ